MKLVTGLKIVCNKCGVLAVGHTGHVGKRHQACDGRKPGSGTPRKDCGTWTTK